MEKNEIATCPQCGTKFPKTRIDKIYCSKKCRAILKNREMRAAKKEESVELLTGCPYNEALECTKRQCDSCGWNPVVAERRLNNGILR